MPTSQGEHRIAFVGFYASSDSNGLSGAAMVTDEYGFPLEFRVSTPVRPTKIQQALYGRSLEPYISSELLGTRLVGEIKQSIELAVVNKLTGLGVRLNSPVGFVAHDETFVHEERSGHQYRRIESQGGSQKAIAVVARRSDDMESLIQLLSRCVSNFDPVEAFDRMETALKALAESDERYR